MADKQRPDKKKVETPLNRTIFSQQINPNDLPYDLQKYIVKPKGQGNGNGQKG